VFEAALQVKSMYYDKIVIENKKKGHGNEKKTFFYTNLQFLVKKMV